VRNSGIFWILNRFLGGYGNFSGINVKQFVIDGQQLSLAYLSSCILHYPLYKGKVSQFQHRATLLFTFPLQDPGAQPYVKNGSSCIYRLYTIYTTATFTTTTYNHNVNQSQHLHTLQRKPQFRHVALILFTRRVIWNVECSGYF